MADALNQTHEALDRLHQAEDVVKGPIDGTEAIVGLRRGSVVFYGHGKAWKNGAALTPGVKAALESEGHRFEVATDATDLARMPDDVRRDVLETRRLKRISDARATANGDAA